jgi:hypothetical protein
MGTLAGEITGQMKESRKSIERSLSDIQDQMGAENMSRAGMVVAGVMVAALAVGVGWMVYQRRRQRSLIERIQAAIPDVVKDLPDEVRARVKAL